MWSVSSDWLNSDNFSPSPHTTYLLRPRPSSTLAFSPSSSSKPTTSRKLVALFKRGPKLTRATAPETPTPADRSLPVERTALVPGADIINTPNNDQKSAFPNPSINNTTSHNSPSSTYASTPRIQHPPLPPQSPTQHFAPISPNTSPSDHPTSSSQYPLPPPPMLSAHPQNPHLHQPTPVATKASLKAWWNHFTFVQRTKKDHNFIREYEKGVYSLLSASCSSSSPTQNTLRQLSISSTVTVINYPLAAPKFHN